MKKVFNSRKTCRREDDKVSIIIPIYKAKISDLKKCLSSILSQYYRNIEILCIADGEKGVYNDFFQKYYQDEPRIRLVEIDHGGVSAARNRGMQIVQGRWLMFVDSDDWIHRNMVDKMVACATENHADMVMVDYFTKYKRSVRVHNYRKNSCVFNAVDNIEFLEDVLKPQTGAGFVWGKLFSRQFLIEKGIMFNEKLVAAEDAEFMLRAAYSMNCICYLKESLYYYRFNSESAVRKYQENYVDKYINAMEEIKTFISRNREIWSLRDAYYNCLLYHLLLIIVNYSFHPDKPESFRGKMKEFKDLVRQKRFQQCFAYIHYEYFSLSRRITLLCLRLHFYFGIYLITCIRHIQFRRIN